MKDYQLMRNAHFETDAQNWHILGTELFNSKFDRRSGKILLRIYLKQPSPSWLDYTLRNITLYMKKIESKGPSSSTSSAQSTSTSPFENMKNMLRNNLKGLKKEEDKDGEGAVQTGASGAGGQRRLQDVIPPFSYGEDIRKIDLL